MKIKITAILDYDDSTMHSNDIKGRTWFREEVLLGEESDLVLHSNYIGDEVGAIKIIKITGRRG